MLWLDKVPSAEIDMTLVGWVTAALVLFHRALESESAAWWVLALLCVAFGTLTKWTAPAFFYFTVVPLLAWRGELRLLLGWRHLLAAGVAVGVCTLWASAVAQQVGWETLVGTVQSEAAYRFAPKSAARGYPFSEVGTYPLLVLAAHLPLSLFALATLRPSFFQRWDDRGKLLLQLLHCWTWPNLLFWSLVPNHNVRYALPLSPGLMGLGVMGLLVFMKTNPQSPSLRGKGAFFSPFPLREGGRGVRFFLLAFLFLWLIAKIVFVQFVIPHRTANRNPEPIAAGLRELVPLDRPLYLFHLKDEGVMFYYARPAVRLRVPRELPPGAFAVLIRQEWEDRAAFGHVELVHWMPHQQDAPLIVFRAP